MDHGYTTLSPIAALLVEAIASYGLDPAIVLGAGRLDPAVLSDPDARVSARSLRRACALAVEACGDPAFGLRIAAAYRPACSHAFGLAWYMSPSLFDALKRLDRYGRFLTTAVALRFRSDSSPPALLIEDKLENLAQPEPIDACFGIALRMCRSVWGDEFAPLRCAMKRREPDDRGSFDAFFACPVEYGTSDNRIEFDMDELQRPLIGGNDGLAKECDQILERHLAAFDRNDYVLRARVAITRLLPSGLISEQRVAESLNVSPRTLQRRLREEHTSYQQILQETRHELAVQHLKYSKYSIAETTYLLGYENTSNFTRAFKSWTGMTPTAALAGA